MGNRRLYKIEHFHTLGTSESERLKVTALNLFHPTASPRLPKDRFLYAATQSHRAGLPGNIDMITQSALTPLRESVTALPAPAAGRRGIQPTCPSQVASAKNVILPLRSLNERFSSNALMGLRKIEEKRGDTNNEILFSAPFRLPQIFLNALSHASIVLSKSFWV